MGSTLCNTQCPGYVWIWSESKCKACKDFTKEATCTKTERCVWTDGKCKGSVSCGNHNAVNCSACPQGHGVSWCHGDCQWLNAQCVPKANVDYGSWNSTACPTGYVHMTNEATCRAVVQAYGFTF